MHTTHRATVRQDATASEKLQADLNSVPMDVFDLAESGLMVETLTSGHGMIESAASGTNCPSWCSS